MSVMYKCKFSWRCCNQQNLKSQRQINKDYKQINKDYKSKNKFNYNHSTSQNIITKIVKTSWKQTLKINYKTLPHAIHYKPLFSLMVLCDCIKVSTSVSLYLLTLAQIDLNNYIYTRWRGSHEHHCKEVV